MSKELKVGDKVRTIFSKKYGVITFIDNVISVSFNDLSYDVFEKEFLSNDKCDSESRDFIKKIKKNSRKFLKDEVKNLKIKNKCLQNQIKK